MHVPVGPFQATGEGVLWRRLRDRVTERRRFRLLMVKPSHYDDSGYVLQWMRSPIPSNSLASLFGLAKDCAERKVLGPDVDIEIHAFDETNTRIRPDKLAAHD